MRSFAFLTHSLNNKQLRRIWPLLNIVPGFAVDMESDIRAAVNRIDIRVIADSLFNRLLDIKDLIFTNPLKKIEFHGKIILHMASHGTNRGRKICSVPAKYIYHTAVEIARLSCLCGRWM